MPKNTRRTRTNNRRKGQLPNGTIRYKGTLKITANATTTASSITLDSFVISTGGSPFLSYVGDAFQMYAFDKIQVIALPITPSGANSVVFGYQNEILDTAPTSQSQILDFPWNGFMETEQTVPMRSTIPRRILRGQNMENLWRTQLPSQTIGTTAASSNLWQSVQGAFWFRTNAGTAVLDLIMRYTVILSSPCANSINPGPRARTEALLGFPHLVPDSQDVWQVTVPPKMSGFGQIATTFGTLSGTAGKKCEHDVPNSLFIACWCPSRHNATT